MKSEKEINKMCEYAHRQMEGKYYEYWRGVKHALFWVLGVTDEISPD